MKYSVSPAESQASVRAGDFILCHRRGLASAMIRSGERIRFRSGSRWSHAAFVDVGSDEGIPQVIEALTRGVTRTPLSAYRGTEYVVVHVDLNTIDRVQALAFARSCLDQPYGWWTIFCIALRFLTPGRGLFGALNGTEICSGLVAQALCRGWANFKVNPAAITPAELAEAYDVPDRPISEDGG